MPPRRLTGEVANPYDDDSYLRAVADGDGPTATRDKRVADKTEDILVSREATARANALGRATVPEADSLDEFLDEVDEEVPYRIDGMSLANGRTLVVGAFKSGKTTLRNNYIRSLTDGDEFLGDVAYPIDDDIGVIDLEMSRNQSRRDLARQKIVNSDRVHIWHLRGVESSFQIMDPQGRSGWAAEIRAARIGHMMLDCLAPALAANDLTESNEDIQRFLNAWDALMYEAGVPESTIFHHMGHVGDRGRGGSALRGWPDAEWKISRPNPRDGNREIDDPSAPRYFRAYGRGGIDVAEFRLGFDPDTQRLSYEDGNRYQDAMEALRDPVLAYVRENPGCGVTRVRENVDGDNTLVGRMLERLADETAICVHRKGQAKYHYPAGECPDPAVHEPQRLSAGGKKR